MTSHEQSPSLRGITVLAGDIGGTNSRLAIYENGAGGLTQVAQRTYPSGDYGDVGEILSSFLTVFGARCDLACLGLPGPVNSERTIHLTNLPWQVDRGRICRTLRTDRVEFINDVEASAAGVSERAAGEFVCLHEGQPDPLGNRAVISVGTGLGVAGLSPSGRAFATEAGHATFSPRSDFDLGVMRDLGREYDHVSWERVAAGPALPRIYALLAAVEASRLDAPAIVDRADSDPVCRQTVVTFSTYLGAVAGNIALTMMATGGVFFCGGVAPRIFHAIGAGAMLAALFDKGRMRSLLERIPIFLVRDEDLALVGAARTALRRAAST